MKKNKEKSNKVSTMTMLWFELISSIFMFLGVVLIIILAIKFQL